MKMVKYLALIVVIMFSIPTAFSEPLKIIDRPITFSSKRVGLTRKYIKQHYGLKVTDITIVPKAIVVHWTSIPSLDSAWHVFNRETIRKKRRHLARAGAVNVSAHFLVDRDGTIYRLMPETWMARHCIGLNYDSIGIENVGGGKKWPLTQKQLKANAALIRFLVRRHPIRFLLGHMEWQNFAHAPFFRELDPNYRSLKDDPGSRFMKKLRGMLKDLQLKSSPAPKGTEP